MRFASYIKDGRPQTAVDALFILSPSAFSGSRESLCSLDDHRPGHALGWCRLPESWCRPCSPVNAK